LLWLQLFIFWEYKIGNIRIRNTSQISNFFERLVVIMKRLRLKITGLVFFVLAAVIGVYVLWPAKSPDVGQIRQKDTSVSAVQPSAENPQPNRQLAPEDFQPVATSRLQDQNPRQQELRDRAALLSSLYRNPDSPDAAKARESLLKAPRGQFAPFRKDSGFKFLNVPRGNNTKQLPPKPSTQEDEQADAIIEKIKV
jgi:hypothetical protein